MKVIMTLLFLLTNFCFGQVLYRDLQSGDIVMTNNVNRTSEIIVDWSGGGNYTTISQALARVDEIHATNATEFVNIRVLAGSYSESLTVKPYTILRGDVRRSRILKPMTVIANSTFIDSLYFYGNTGSPLITYTGGTGAGYCYLTSCYIYNASNTNAPSCCILITNKTSTSNIQLRNCEVYTQNRNAGTEAKAIVIKTGNNIGQAYLEFLDNRLKTSGPDGKEYLFWGDGTDVFQVENSYWLSVHGINPLVHLDGNASFLWFEGTLFNYANPSKHITFEGTSKNIYYYGKEVGDMKILRSLELGLNKLTSNGTNLFQTTVNFVTNVVTVSEISSSNTVYSMWAGTESDFILETNRTSGEVNGRIYFIQ